MPRLQLEDATLSYSLMGTGSPVLFIHGMGVCGSAWRPQIVCLSDQFQCLTFDNRGVGASEIHGSSQLTIQQMAADARALMDVAGWRSAHVVGHSMGGLVAQQLALETPDRVRTLSLLCTFSSGREATSIRPATLWLTARTKLGSATMRRRAVMKMLFPHVTNPTPELAARVGMILGRDLANRAPIMREQLRAMRQYDASSQLERLGSIPTLVAGASLDPIARIDCGRRLSSLIPGSRFVEIENAAHGVTFQEFEFVNDLLREHFMEGERHAGLATHPVFAFRGRAFAAVP